MIDREKFPEEGLFKCLVIEELVCIGQRRRPEEKHLFPAEDIAYAKDQRNQSLMKSENWKSYSMLQHKSAR